MVYAIAFVMMSAGFVELMLTKKWNLAYFKSGFIVFRACRQVATQPLTSVDTEKLGSLLPETKLGKLQFRKAAGNLYVFREEYSADPEFHNIESVWFFPVMHGNLIIDQAREQIEVIGRLCWWPLILTLMPVLLVLFSWQRDWLLFMLWAALAFVYVASAASYLVQKKRFAQVADLAAKM